MSEAVYQFDYHMLPEPIRHDIDKLSTAKASANTNNPAFVKDKLRVYYAAKAEDFYKSASELNIEKKSTGLSSDAVPYEKMINSSPEDNVVFV